MFSVILRELLLPLLIFLLVRSLLRSVFAALRPPVRRAGTRQQQSAPTAGVLKKDPVCGTYVSTGSAITRTVKGETVYFCSQECAEKFEKTEARS